MLSAIKGRKRKKSELWQEQQREIQIIATTKNFLMYYLLTHFLFADDKKLHPKDWHFEEEDIKCIFFE